jgi:hypothetical protein
MVLFCGRLEAVDMGADYVFSTLSVRLDSKAHSDIDHSKAHFIWWTRIVVGMQLLTFIPMPVGLTLMGACRASRAAT